MKLKYPPGATPLDPDERRGLIPSTIATQADLNEFEQANIRRASEKVLGRAQKNLLTESFTRDLHRRMFHEVWKWAGQYRRSDKNIGVAWLEIPSEVTKLCADASYWVTNRSFEWIELGARFHHRLVAIHPFPNGNGRHARLMTDSLLKANGQPMFTWGSVGDLGPVTDARARYIAALRLADERQFDALIAFVRS